MSAFPESGRSDHQKSGEFRVRFRPEAVIRVKRKPRHEGGASSNGSASINKLYDAWAAIRVRVGNQFALLRARYSLGERHLNYNSELSSLSWPAQKSKICPM